MPHRSQPATRILPRIPTSPESFPARSHLSKKTARPSKGSVDRLEPLLWPESKHLLDGPPHKTALAVLEEFLTQSGEKLIEDPLKRAVLQRDLWAVFDWAANPAWAANPEGDHPTERHALQHRLAKIIQRLALSAEAIRAASWGDIERNWSRAMLRVLKVRSRWPVG